MSEVPAPPADSSQRDRILHGIGRVAQAHVDLDRALRELLNTLHMPDRILRGMAEVLPPPVRWAAASVPTGHSGPGWNFKKLVEACKAKLATMLTDETFRDAGLAALTDTLNANELRDRVVHDMWVERPAAEGTDAQVERWQRIPKTSGFQIYPTDLDYIEKAQTKLRRSTVRVMELNWYVSTLMTPPPPPEWPPEATADPNDLLAVIQGSFTLEPDGGYRPCHSDGDS
jgi:hypothetical protein